MASLSKGYTFGATETATNTKLHDLIDLGSISGIVNADVAAGAAIASTKLELASAGYLTSGGNFDVTGKYSFSDLSWANIGSLASINDAQIQTMQLTSLASMVDIQATNITITDGILTSLMSLSTAHVSTLRSGAPNQGDVLYDDGTNLARLTPGTSGQFLKTQGAAANPVWGDAAWVFIESNSFSAAADPITITETVAEDEVLMIIWEFEVASANIEPALRVNGDSSGNNYDWVNHGLNSSATTIDEGSGSDDEIRLVGASGGVLNGSENHLISYVTSRNSTTQITFQFSSFDTICIMTTGVGRYDAAAMTSLSLVDAGGGAGTFTGRNYVYKAGKA